MNFEINLILSNQAVFSTWPKSQHKDLYFNISCLQGVFKILRLGRRKIVTLKTC